MSRRPQPTATHTPGIIRAALVLSLLTGCGGATSGNSKDGGIGELRDQDATDSGEDGPDGGEAYFQCGTMKCAFGGLYCALDVEPDGSVAGQCETTNCSSCNCLPVMPPCQCAISDAGAIILTCAY